MSSANSAIARIRSEGLGAALGVGIRRDQRKPSFDTGKKKIPILFEKPTAGGGLVRGSNGDIGLDLVTFSRYIAYHPFCQMFFGLGQPE